MLKYQKLKRKRYSEKEQTDVNKDERKLKNGK
jgi:hypothetical protein